MESKDSKSTQSSTTHREVPTDTDSLNQPLLGSSKSSKAPNQRPGETIMSSDDPRTAALRAWAEDKQTQVPGSDGSFAVGPMSMGVGAVSGGPMFLPRKEYIVEPPYHSVDHGPVETLKHGEQGDDRKKKKRHSFSNLFKRTGSGPETETKEDADMLDEDHRGKTKRGSISNIFHRKGNDEEGKSPLETEVKDDVDR